MTNQQYETKLVESEEERQIIGKCMNKPGCIDGLAAMLTAEDFSNTRTQKTFQIIIDLHREGKMPDLVTVAERARNNGIDIAWLSKLNYCIPFNGSIAQWADKIKQESNRRSLIRVYQQEIESLQRGDDLEEIAKKQ